MKRRVGPCVLGLIALVLALSGAPRWAVAASPFATAPWSDGEKASYVGLAPNGSPLSATEITLTLHEGTWDLVEGANEISFRDDLFTARSRHRGSSAQVEAVYSDREVRVAVTPSAGGAAKETTLALEGPAVDNDALLTAIRALPLAPGFEVRLVTVVPRSGVSPVTLRVGAPERVSVPAGDFEAYPVNLDFGITAHRAFYGVEPPHWLVKYENRTTKGSLVLRSFQRSPHDPPQGALDPPALPSRDKTPPVRWEIVLLACLVQYPLMLVFPAWLAYRVKKKTSLPAKVWGLGALAFIASQVVHLPLNWALGLLGAPRGVALLPFPAYAAVVGLSAGLCEELARYLMLRFALRNFRDDRTSLLFGVGHGGIESIIFGVLAGAGLLNMTLVCLLSPKTLGVPPEATKDLIAAALGFWNANPSDFVVAGLERLGAIAFHVMATHLVMRAVARRRAGWLVLAIVAHAVFDGLAVASMKALGGYATSAIFFAAGFLCVGITLALRRSPPAVETTSVAPARAEAASS